MIKSKTTTISKTKNPLEGLRDTAGMLDDGGKITQFAPDFFSQIIGSSLSADKAGQEEPAAEQTQEHISAGGEFSEGEWVSFTSKHTESTRAPEQSQKPHAETARKPEIEAAIEYHREIKDFDKHAAKVESNETSQQIQEILAELRKLISSSKSLSMRFSDIATEEPKPLTGKYYINYYEWMIAVVRSARQNIDEANSWLGNAHSKNSKKNNYWGMAKKHGTSFTLSDERNPATNVG